MPAAPSAGGRLLREVALEEPIRYGPEDPVEQWLMSLLCLNAADHMPRVPPTLPHPDECELFYVERDTLFSGHRVTEVALQRMMSLYVASHYKNTPNDLLLLSDAPAHHLFVLTAPVPDKAKVWLFHTLLCMLSSALMQLFFVGFTCTCECLSPCADIYSAKIHYSCREALILPLRYAPSGRSCMRV